MRKRISDLNKIPSSDLKKEYEKIEFLFSNNKCIGLYNRYGSKMTPNYTFQEYLAELQFTSWDLHGIYISLQEMREDLGVDEDTMLGNFSNDRLLDFLQFILNCIFYITNKIRGYRTAYLYDDNLIQIIIDNSKILLDKLNYGIEIESRTSEIYLVANNQTAAAVAEVHMDIAESVIEYRRHDYKGDLKRKGEILCTLFKKLESVEKRFQGTTYGQLISDTTFLFNKTGARHWVEADRIASNTFMKMSPEDLEKWYDRTYDLFLTSMQVSDYLGYKKEISELKTATEKEEKAN